MSLVVFTALLAICGFSSDLSAQPAQNQPPPVDRSNNSSRDAETSATMGDMIVKQQISRRKKEYEELLRRGEEALKLSEDLEHSYTDDSSFTSEDLQKLQSLEKMASKIRNELGGNDEGEAESDAAEGDGKLTFSSAIKALRSSTKKLLDELKRTTRFSVSVVAIQTSNSVIRLARFLRIRK